MSCNRKNCAELSGNICKGKCSPKSKPSIYTSLFDEVLETSPEVKTLDYFFNDSPVEENLTEANMMVKSISSQDSVLLERIAKKTGLIAIKMAVINNPATNLDTLEHFIFNDTDLKIKALAQSNYYKRLENGEL